MFAAFFHHADTEFLFAEKPQKNNDIWIFY